MTEEYYSFNKSVRRVWNRIADINVAEAKGGLEKVEELGQKDVIPGNVT